jgi:hypothetical protein
VTSTLGSSQSNGATAAARLSRDPSTLARPIYKTELALAQNHTSLLAHHEDDDGRR